MTSFALRGLAGALLALRRRPLGRPGAPAPGTAKAGDNALGTRRYEDYERPRLRQLPHVDIARQHEQAMMSQAFTHT